MKKFTFALLMTWLGAGAAVTYLWGQLHQLRNENSELHARVMTLEARRLIAAAAPQQVAISDIAAPPASPASAPAPPPSVEQTVSTVDDQDFRRSMTRATLTQMYPDLGNVLGLTSGEFDKLEDLLTRQFTSKTFGRSPADQTELTALLGDKYPQWQAYQESLPGRRQVSQLRGQLAASGATLSDAQAQSLMAALNAELKRAEQDRRSLSVSALPSAQEVRDRELHDLVDNSNRLAAAAAPLLNPQQLDSYRHLLDQQLQMRRMMMDVMSTGSARPK